MEAIWKTGSLPFGIQPCLRKKIALKPQYRSQWFTSFCAQMAMTFDSVKNVPSLRAALQSYLSQLNTSSTLLNQGLNWLLPWIDSHMPRVLWYTMLNFPRENKSCRNFSSSGLLLDTARPLSQKSMISLAAMACALLENTEMGWTVEYQNLYQFSQLARTLHACFLKKIPGKKQTNKPNHPKQPTQPKKPPHNM